MDFIAIFAAQYLIFLIVFLGIAFFLHRPNQEKREIIIFSIITTLIVFIISKICRTAYFNPRPIINNQFLALIPHKTENGFPSIHTLISATIAMSVWHFNKKIGMLLLVLATIVGLARVFVGVHHYLDIFTSIIISVAVVLIIEKTVWHKIKSHHHIIKIFNKLNVFNP